MIHTNFKTFFHIEATNLHLLQVWLLNCGLLGMELVFALLNLLAEEIELDAKIIVGLLENPDLANNSNAIIVADYRESLKENSSSLDPPRL